MIVTLLKNENVRILNVNEAIHRDYSNIIVPLFLLYTSYIPRPHIGQSLVSYRPDSI